MTIDRSFIGTKFTNQFMPDFTFEVLNVLPGCNQMTVRIIPDDRNRQSWEEVWNLTHFKWAFERSEYKRIESEVMNMTPTPWIDEDSGFIYGNDRTIVMAVRNINPNEEEKANKKAVVSAVNGTYGAGINPEAVKDMYEALQMAIPYIQGAYECAFPDEDWNESVLFQAKAALDKALIKP